MAARGTAGEKLDTETMEITDEDAAFILGKGGRTKQKIIKVSGCAIELNDQELTLEFTGTRVQRRKAQKYVRCVVAQRTGVVTVTEEDVSEDCTVLTVPQPAIGFVTGAKGNFLRTLEDEHSVIMCFAVQEGMEASDEVSDLMIFGTRLSRRGAQLAVMSVVETKVPGYYTDRWRESGSTFDDKTDLNGDWGTSTLELSQEELSYAIGSHGKTRKKIARASCCVVQYLTSIVFISGTKKQREHAKEYLKWLLEQLEGPIHIDIKGRDDATILEVPLECIGYVTGNRRETLGLVEETFGALTFFLAKGGEEKSEKLAIFGSVRARKGAELMVMSAVERKAEGHYTGKMTDRKTTTKSFDVDRLTMDPEDMAYARGREGSTRSKLETASGAILQFVGPMAFIAGDAMERQRCRDYLGWLLEQKDGKVSVDTQGRSDITELALSGEDDVGFILGSGLGEMRKIEAECGVFCMMLDTDEGGHQLLICGHEEGSSYSPTGRLKALRLLTRLVTERNVRSDYHGGKGGGKSSWKGGGGWRDRSRSPRRSSWSSGGTGKGSWQSGAVASWSSGARAGKGNSWSSGATTAWRREDSWSSRPAPRAAAGTRSPTPPWRKSGGGGGGGSWGAKRW